MNTSDKIELLRLAKSNTRLQRLIKKHEGYKEQLRLIRKQKVFTAKEEQTVRELKLQKLRNKDEMIRIVRSMKSVEGSVESSFSAIPA
ncbi:MAG: hypothetical protein KDD70_17450 [Bdellovibrionales bacterium]|nr:hypothetical protein [Bdellovibrionales bacterium]